MKKKNTAVKKFKCISIHFGTKCNKNPPCKYCYTNKNYGKAKDVKWFCNLIPYLKTLTEQIALGGGEPLLYPNFIKKFSSACKKNGLICNLTTNGLSIMKVDKKVFDNSDMISISFNDELIKTSKDVHRFMRDVWYLKKNTNVKIGCNLLINKDMFNSSLPKNSSMFNSFKEIVDYLFSIGVNNVYALYPKNYKLGVDLTRHKAVYLYLTLKYNGENGRLFVVDDLTKEILEQGYNNWKKPCHRGTGLISINPDGSVLGCSFGTQPILKLNKPKDILKINKIKIKPRYKCPYLIK